MSKSVHRDDLVAFLDNYLRVSEIPDKSPNGLQVQGRARIAKLALAVDASVQTIEGAARAGADMLVVHHGLWWGKHEQIVGNMHQRVAALISNDISLYTAHLPLDCHPEVGNNVELARLFGLDVVEGFGEYEGTMVGVIAVPHSPMRLDALLSKMHKVLRAEPAALRFGPAAISRVAIISGGAALYAENAKRAGCDTFITGETSHGAHHVAREASVNLIYGGHYATETVGLKALARRLQKDFSLSSRFIPAPTGY